MNKQVTFVTGNAEKIRDAAHAAKDYPVEVLYEQVEIDEIQHHDPMKIAEHKTKSAYAQLQKPVVVNDSFWTIPALGGFPGGYMKDITSWLSAEDFLSMMKGKSDQSIILTDVNGFYDGQTYKSFVTVREGKFTDAPIGNSLPSFAKVVKMEGDDITISEIFDQPERTIDSSRYAQWHEFLEWYSKS